MLSIILYYIGDYDVDNVNYNDYNINNNACCYDNVNNNVVDDILTIFVVVHVDK